MRWLSDLLEPRPRRRPVYGWWAYDDATSTLRRDDGARLRFVGYAADDAALALRGTGNRRWLRFDVHVRARTYPLLVERRDVLDLIGSVLSSRRLVWRLDHVRSARLGGETPPEPALWREVDRVAVDALYCWPEESSAGVRPSDVAVSGGWCNGAWTASYYRAFSGSGIGAYPGSAVFVHAPLGAPRRWEFVPAARAESVSEAEATFRAFARAHPSQIADLLPSLTRGRPHLRANGALLVPLFVIAHSRATGREVTLRWLYADDVLITDRLRCTADRKSAADAPSWTFQLEARDCLVGTVDRLRGAYLDFARVTGAYAHRGERQDGLFAEHGSFPEAALAALREVVGEALWSWQDVTLAIPHGDGAARDVRLAPPAVASLWPATQYGGGERATTMRVAPSVDGASGYMDLATMFVDDDCYAPTAREPRVGRFDFDGATLTMLDEDAGRTLSFERTLAGSADAAHEQLGLFRYTDAEGTYPLVVRRLARTRSDAAGEWILDHDASAERWRSDARAEGAPPQARWRRVAAFAFDALLAWPDTAAFGPAAAAVVAASGWWSGRWSRDVRRRGTTRLFEFHARDSLRARAGVAPLAFLPPDAEVPRVAGTGPADPEPTLAWRRASDSDLADGPLPMIDLDPPGAIEVDAIDLVAVATERLRGRPCWLREDGAALLYVCGHVEQNVGPEYAMAMCPVYEYADADIRVRLHTSAPGRDHALWLHMLHWPRIVRTSPFAEGGQGLPPDLFLRREGSSASWQPHPRLWHRLVDAAEAQLDPARTGRRSAVRMDGAYVADEFDVHARRAVWFDGPDEGAYTPR